MGAGATDHALDLGVTPRACVLHLEIIGRLCGDGAGTMLGPALQGLQNPKAGTGGRYDRRVGWA